VSNVGSRAFRIISIGVGLFDLDTFDAIYPRMEVSRYRDVVISPTTPLTFEIDSKLILGIADRKSHGGYATWISVHCADTLNSADHTFIYRCESGDVLYFVGSVTWDILETRFKQRR
jgi:hypothetical protein